MADQHDMNGVNPNPDWQDKDIQIAPMVIAVVVVILTTLFTFIGINVMIKVYNQRAEKQDLSLSPLATTRTVPSGPLLQVNPLEELAIHHEQEAALLDHYEWIDPATGLAKIPIDRAIKVLAEQGLPAREEESPAAN